MFSSLLGSEFTAGILLLFGLIGTVFNFLIMSILGRKGRTIEVISFVLLIISVALFSFGWQIETKTSQRVTSAEMELALKGMIAIALIIGILTAAGMTFVRSQCPRWVI